MTDEEILTPGKLTFPNGGTIVIDSVGDTHVYFRRWMPGASDADADWVRTSIRRFVRGVRAAKGERA